MTGGNWHLIPGGGNPSLAIIFFLAEPPDRIANVVQLTLDDFAMEVFRMLSVIETAPSFVVIGIRSGGCVLSSEVAIEKAGQFAAIQIDCSIMRFFEILLPCA